MSTIQQIRPQDARRRYGRGGRRKHGIRLVEDADPAPDSVPPVVIARNIRLQRRSNGRIGQQSQQQMLPADRAISSGTNGDSASSSADVAASETLDDGPDDNFAPDTGEGDRSENPGGKKATRKQKSRRGIDRMNRWLPFRDAFLDELLRLEGPSERSSCVMCHAEGQDLFRCGNCFAHPLCCRSCLLQSHKRLPLHNIEVWTGIYFKKTSLREQGLAVQLGHDIDFTCPHQGRHVKKFVVCDVSGFHDVDLTFCACLRGESTTPLWIQLFRVGWFPASTEKPNTAFTLGVLDFFQQLNFQAKANLYDFQRTLTKISGNAGRHSWNRYRPMSDVIRQYRNLVLLKRGGCCHNPAGIFATREGTLAVTCPACPHPDRNLPQNWAQGPANTRWLYMLFLMLDANFKLRLKDRGIEDVELAPGWAYYVNEEYFQRHIDEHHKVFGDAIEENTCSAEHNAIVKANLRRDGYIASGVGAVLCARHCLVRPNGVADLQKGERYVNMDYLLLRTLVGFLAGLIVLSYDIACQYNKNFNKRMKAFPPEMHLPADTQMRFVIPKKHFTVHGPNHSMYSLNYLPQVARTYGEGIESGWHVFNPVSTATREMGPAMRHEVLNDHWGAWNWDKILNLGTLLGKNLVQAFEKRESQTTRFNTFSATFPEETIAQWNTSLQRWLQDPKSKPDPFEEPETKTTMIDIRLKLAQVDADDVANGSLVYHEVTPGVLIQMGMEIEDRQRTLATRAKEKLTTAEQASLQEKRNKLAQRIELWRKIQELYLPIAAPLWAASGLVVSGSNNDDDSDTRSPTLKAEDATLFLPSQLPDQYRVADSVKALSSRECELRRAQAFDALTNIRRLRRIITGISLFKQRNLLGEGQRTTTRLRSYYQKFHAKIKHSAATYRIARKALLILDPTGDWKTQLLDLKPEDIRGPGKDIDEEELGEGHRDISWIWLVQPGILGTERVTEDFIEGMRVEWAKAQARAQRWKEEAELLQEEMRRVLAYMTWHAGWWRGKAAERVTDTSPSLRQGLSAYAEKQAIVREDLGQKFAKQWMKILHTQKIIPTWASQYPAAVTAASSTKKGKGKQPQRGPDEDDSDDSDSSSEDEDDEDMDVD